MKENEELTVPSDVVSVLKLVISTSGTKRAPFSTNKFLSIFEKAGSYTPNVGEKTNVCGSVRSANVSNWV